MKDCVTAIRIFYDDFYYNIVEESPFITPDGLLGLIGGQIGLFIGVSVMTFFEVFEFWILLSINLYNFIRNRPRIKTINVIPVNN